MELCCFFFLEKTKTLDVDRELDTLNIYTDIHIFQRDGI